MNVILVQKELRGIFVETKLFIDSYYKKERNYDKESGFTRLGRGIKGVGIGFNLLDKRTNKSFPIALKVIKIQNKDMKNIENEIEALRDYSKEYPLSTPRYLTCFKEQETKKVFILTEQLEYKTTDFEWTWKLQNFTKTQCLEMILHMTRSLLNLNQIGYTHNDIGSHNWVTQPGFYSMPKLIDFGSATYYPTNDKRLDQIIPDKQNIQYRNRIIQDNHKLAKHFTKLKKKFMLIPKTPEKLTEFQILDIMNDIVIGLMKSKNEKVMTLEEAVAILENLLMKLDKDSLFLPNNQYKLYELFSKDSFLDSERYIITFESCMGKYNKYRKRTRYQLYITCLFLLY